jgi:hypothetical protein
MFEDSMFQQIPKDPCVMPTLGRATRVPERTPAQGERREVGVLFGRMQREFLLGVNAATGPGAGC